MAYNIQFKRGLKKDLPQLFDGEVGYAQDTEELFIGSLEGNKRLTFDSDKHAELSEQLAQTNTKVKPKAINLSDLYTDSTIDATPIIEGLLDQGYNTIMLPEKLRLNTTLNLTDRESITFIGCGRRDVVGTYTEVQLNTGGIGIDMVGAQSLLFKDMNITSENMQNPSTVGVLEGRSVTNKWAQFNRMDNVKIRMHHDVTANNGKGTVALYNFKSELNTYNHTYFVADIPMVMTISNIFNITSPYVIHDGEATCKSTSFTGVTAFVARMGHAMILDGVADLSFTNLYMQRSPYDGSTEEYAILITAPYSAKGVGGIDQVVDYQVNNINIDLFENEFFPSFLKVQAKTSNCNLVGQHTHGQGKIIYIPSNDTEHQNSLGNSVVRINRSTPIEGDTQDYIYCESGSFGFNGNLVFTANSKYLVTLLQPSFGNIFIGNVQPNISMPNGGENMTFGAEGLRLNGRNLKFSFSKPTHTNASTGSVVFNTNTQLGSVSYWQWDGSVWRECGQIGVRLEATTPVGLRTPYRLGEEIYDNVNKRWYKSTGLTNVDWVALN